MKVLNTSIKLATVGVLIFVFSSVAVSNSNLFANSNKTSKVMNDSKGGLECEVVTHIENAYLANHLTVNVRDKKLEERVIEQYIKRIDPAKVYLLASDVEVIKGLMKNVFDKTKKADCTFLTEVQN